jgi:hypothetical protein
VTLVGAWIATQYVHTHVFALVVPALVGVGCAAAATAAAGRGGMAVPLAVAVPAALVAVGLADRFVAGGGISAVSPAAQAGPPYLAAVAGAVGWTVLSRPSGGPGGRGRAG